MWIHEDKAVEKIPGVAKFLGSGSGVPKKRRKACAHITYAIYKRELDIQHGIWAT
jgi:hypothetical protein